MNSLLLDNGSHSCKYAYFNCTHENRHDVLDKVTTVPNLIAKPKAESRRYYGQDLLTHCHDYTSLQFTSPFEQGMLTYWPAQVELWERLFASIPCDISSTQLVLTEPLFNLPNLQSSYDQVIFEYFEFPFCKRIAAPLLVGAASTLLAGGCRVVVDLGHAFTHVVPFIENVPNLKAALRIEVGGDLLTTELKKDVSFRQYNMMDEWFIMNQVKETCCFVATHFEQEMKQLREHKQAPLHYVMPDYSRRKPGRIKTSTEETKDEDEQILIMGNERIRIPELLFCPQDAGVAQSGLAETIALSIQKTCSDPDYTWNDMDRRTALESLLYSHIELVGGSSLFEGLLPRLERELTMLAPQGTTVGVRRAKDPIVEATKCGVHWVYDNNNNNHLFVSRARWQEEGSERLRMPVSNKIKNVA